MNLTAPTPLHRRQAFTWIEVLLVMVVIVVLAGLILPQMARPRRTRAPRIKCVNNLKNLGLAARIFSTDNDGKFPWQVPIAKGGSMEEIGDTNRIWRHFQVLSNELSTPRTLQCPTDPRLSKLNTSGMTFNTVTNSAGLRFGHNDHVSYFLNVTPSEEEPESILGGDRNLTRNNTPIRGRIGPMPSDVFNFTTRGHHDGAGNLVFGDGSVQQVSRDSASRSFADAFVVRGTNPPPLLLIP
jgi:prepilin-type processing-associated H-X9-DG protein